MHHLITFLGKGRKEEGDYRKATYCFDDDHCYESSYFGLALLQNLALSSHPVEHLLILGTSSSIWDALLFDEMRDEYLWDELSTRVQRESVDDELLARVAEDAEDTFRKHHLAEKVSLRIIPFGRDEEEQIAILQLMAGCIKTGDRVSLDITHGFRSLPMLGIISAMFLRKLKGATVDDIFYGALEMTENGRTPVLRLDGLLRLADWLTAISAFRVSGDYGLFAPLLGSENTAAAMEEAGFYEKTLNIAQARSKLRSAVKDFPEIEQNDPVFRMFSPELRGFSSWTEQQTFAGRQMAAACNALETGNFVASAALGVEACITHAMPPGKDSGNYAGRKETRKQLNRQCTKRTTDPLITVYWELRELRNALSHGTRPKKNVKGVQTTLQSRQKLEERLLLLLGQLKNEMQSEL